jgi:predicted transcriptional regulator
MRKENEAMNPIATARIISRATAVEDSLIIHPDISATEFRMACHMLRHQKDGEAPCRQRLADDMHVDKRTIERWIDHLTELGFIETGKTGRRSVYTLLEPRSLESQRSDTKTHSTRHPRGDPTIVSGHPKDDRRIVAGHPKDDPTINDPTINDPTINDPTIVCEINTKAALNYSMNKHDPTIVSGHGGGGGGSFFEKEPPPTTHQSARKKVRPQDITTPTGRWMVQTGFSLDRAFLCQALSLSDCQADFQRRWIELGQRHGAISDAWLVEPPTHLTKSAAPKTAAQCNSLPTHDQAAVVASRIAPSDATEEEIEIIAGELWAGSSEEEAIGHLAWKRAQNAMLEQRTKGAWHARS